MCKCQAQSARGVKWLRFRSLTPKHANYYSACFRLVSYSFLVRVSQRLSWWSTQSQKYTDRIIIEVFRQHFWHNYQYFWAHLPGYISHWMLMMYRSCLKVERRWWWSQRWQDIISTCTFVSLILCLRGYKHDIFAGMSGHLQLCQWQQN